MRRRPGFRVLSALLGLWFLLAGQEPPFAHPCTMVGGPTPPAELHTAHHAGHSAGRHADAPPSLGHEHSGTPEPGAECECIGECGALAPMPTFPLARQILFAPIPLRVVPAPLVAHVARIPGAPPRVQPFANGPPESARA